MAQNVNIINRWSMKQFFINMGKRLQIVDCVSTVTGNNFKMLKFGACFVGFSQKLGELTSSELNTMKNDLQVVELDVPEDVKQKRIAEGRQVESYKLCKAGNPSDKFEEVVLDW